MTLPRRKFLHLSASAVALPALSRVARADTYPSHPVRLLVGFAAGSTTDILGRLIGQWLSQRLGQQFVIENRPGAGGNVAAEEMIKSTPDGYTLYMVPPAVAANAALYPHLNFDFFAMRRRSPAWCACPTSPRSIPRCRSKRSLN